MKRGERAEGRGAKEETRSDCAIRLRIPAWASSSGQGQTIRVNGAPVSSTLVTGFASIQRKWKDGDRIDLEFPMPLRLEPIDPGHPETVALVRGPLVLFAVTEQAPKVTRQQLLAANLAPCAGICKPAWQVQIASGSLLLLPFTAITDERYTTYLTVS